MNKKLRKGLYIGGVGAVVTAGSLSVILPVALKKPSNVKKWTHDPEDKLIGGGLKDYTGNDLIAEVERDFEESRTFTRFDQQFQLYLYDQAQIDSIEEQAMNFEWEIISKVRDLKEIVARGEDTDEAKEDIDNLVEDINELEDKLEVIKKHYDATESKWVSEVSGGLDYSSSSFQSDYPGIKLIKSEIESQQQKRFNDSKNNFIKGYPTRSEGLAAWPEYRNGSYGGALTDKEAVDFLVNRNISISMSSLFAFRIEGSYTVEQKFANKIDFDGLKTALVKTDGDLTLSNLETFLNTTITIGTNPTESLFPFLESASTKAEEAGYQLENNTSDKVYFMSSGSSNINERDIDVTDLTNDKYAEFLSNNQKLMSVSHMLINAKPVAGDPYAPWEVEQDAIRKLYQFIGSSTGSTFRPYSELGLVFQDNEKDDTDSTTDVLIKYASGNSEGTINKEGSLGIQSAEQFVTGMVDGFGLGMIPAYQNAETPGSVSVYDYSNSSLTDRSGNAYPSGSTNSLQVLGDQLHKAQTTIFGSAPTDNGSLDSLLTRWEVDKMNESFGAIFRDVFNPTGSGSDLLFGATKSPSTSHTTGVVVSEQFGIHAIDVSIVSTLAELQTLIQEDLELIANDQDISKAKVDVNQLFSSFYSTDRQYEFVLQNYLGTKGSDEFLDFYLANANDGDKVESQKDIDNVTKTINNNITSENFTAANSAATSKTDWYVQAFIDETRRIDQLDPEDIYARAYEMAGGQ